MKRLALAALALAMAGSAIAQQPDVKALQATQKAQLTKLAYLDGIWRGPAWHVMPDGTRHEIVQTERIGPMLDGTIKVIEGRGYNPDGTTGFNAFAVIAYDVNKQAYTFRSYAMGNQGDFEFTPTTDGYVWKIPAGPMTIEYTAHIQGDRFREIGERVTPDGKRVQFFEMNLKKVSGTDWPLLRPVPMK